MPNGYGGETAIQYGPYYRTSRRAIEGEKRALGQPPMVPGQIAAERYGELGAYLGEARQRREFETKVGFEERGMQLKEEAAETAKTQAQWSGAATGAGAIGAVGTAVGTAVGGTILGMEAGSFLGPAGMVVGGLIGFLAGGK
jgi:F0F1-type ATP synthase assembly protein I